jgi:hypothetical protein
MPYLLVVVYSVFIIHGTKYNFTNYSSEVEYTSSFSCFACFVISDIHYQILSPFNLKFVPYNLGKMITIFPQAASISKSV